MTEAFYFLFLFLVLSLRYACLFTKNVTKKAYSRFNISGFKRMQAEQNQFDQRKLHYSQFTQIFRVKININNFLLLMDSDPLVHWLIQILNLQFRILNLIFRFLYFESRMNHLVFRTNDQHFFCLLKSAYFFKFIATDYHSNAHERPNKTRVAISRAGASGCLQKIILLWQARTRTHSFERTSISEIL